jgi:hypothetical protein
MVMNDISCSFLLNTNMNANERCFYVQMIFNESKQYLQYMNNAGWTF